MLTEKQREYIRNADRRWNIKTGAARSGKTYCDFFVIPMRIRRAGEGTILFLGCTAGTFERNVLAPMRERWGEEAVGRPSNDGEVEVFGRICNIIGASRGDGAEKLQGTGVAYAYGDEITTWDREVFDMLKSRLDKRGACFDGTCNPAGPTHWFRRFLDSGADVYLQEYVIDDNPTLDPDFVKKLKNEYSGTVWYDRYILGKWTACEGAVYPRFASRAPAYRGEGTGRLAAVHIGVDFGGNASATAFVSSAIGEDGTVTVWRTERHTDPLDCVSLSARFRAFANAVKRKYGFITAVYADNAEPILIRTLKGAVSDLGITVRPAVKSRITGRIALVNTLIAEGRLFIGEDAGGLEKALTEAMWDKKEKDTRLDDGSTDIDTLDAFEYTLTPPGMRRLTEGVRR